MNADKLADALRLLESVLCDVDGSACMPGSYADRRTVDEALSLLRDAQPAQAAQPVGVPDIPPEAVPVGEGALLPTTQKGEVADLYKRVQELERERTEFRDALKLATHKIITCGVAARHPDPNLTRSGAYAREWNSQQADDVRTLRDAKDRSEAELAAIKKRIADARFIEIGDTGENGAFKSVWFDFDEGETCYALLPLGEE